MKNTKSRIVLSFDDGRKDNYELAVPVLQKYGLTATFNIATAYVDGEISIEDSPCHNPSMSVDNVKDLNNWGFEIACHGDCHKNDFDDIERGLKKLISWLEWKDDHKPGFASPNSNLCVKSIKDEENKYESMFSYVRVSSYGKEAFGERVIRKLSHLSHSDYLYCKAYNNHIGGIQDGFIATSVPIVNNATTSQVKSLINMAMRSNQDCILMLHSIVKKGNPFCDDMWRWDCEKFDCLCNWLKNEQDKGALIVTRNIDLLQVDN